MKNLKGSILQVAVVTALAAVLALTTSCKNSGNTNSSTDTTATNAVTTDTMSTMKADTMKTDTTKAGNTKAESVPAPLPKKTRGLGRVNEPIPVPTGAIVEDKDH